MIINKQGEKFNYDNIQYVIGEDIVGTEESAYEGLIGKIYEIRTGTDKETYNLFPDLYCKFEAPITEYDIQKFEERFSKLCGEKKCLEDICLDSVILSPNMLNPVENIKEYTVYVLEEDWAANDDYGHNVEVFSEINNAKVSMFNMLKKELEGGCIADWKDDDDYIEDSDENSFECYIDGYHASNHYSISITEKSMKNSAKFLTEIKDYVVSEKILGDVKCRLDELAEAQYIPDKDYSKLINDGTMAEIIMDEVRGYDYLKDSYFYVIADTANEVVEKYLGIEVKDGGKNYVL